VEEGTATLADGWRERLVLVSNANTRHAKGWCLEPHDLVLSKYFAGREKDFRFTRDALAAKLVSADTLRARLGAMPIDEAARERIRQRIAYDEAQSRA
jgi:hypothetical protein